MSSGLAASIHARLLNRARMRGEDFNLVLTRYAIERFLYRLSQVPAREVFWLKGALLFDLWFDVPHRPTRDADFLGFGPADIETLASTIREICIVPVADGMKYDPESMRIEEIREDARYGGLRVRLIGWLGNARCTVQLDVGYGDAVVPGPEEAMGILDREMTAPSLRFRVKNGHDIYPDRGGLRARRTPEGCARRPGIRTPRTTKKAVLE